MNCPKCGKKLRKKWAFKKCRCNKCGYKFKIIDYIADEYKDEFLDKWGAMVCFGDDD